MKMKRKGFTVVELVIVIAVIAILAAVLIPTFSGIINRSRRSNALQEVNAAYKIAYNAVYDDGKITANEGIGVAGIEFIFEENGAGVRIVPQPGSICEGFEFEMVNGEIRIVD